MAKKLDNLSEEAPGVDPQTFKIVLDEDYFSTEEVFAIIAHFENEKPVKLRKWFEQFKRKETVMTINQTIYKKDSKGRVRFLTIHTEGNFVVQTSGVVGTDNPIVNKSACTAKNIGKANYTTPQLQATLEAKAKLTDKLSTGYFYTIEEAEQRGGSSFLLPMLAKDAKKVLNKIKFPCYVQPKLDGMRALGSDTFEGNFMSRTGKAVDTLMHISLAFSDEILDGELYAHGLSFQENMKLIKKYREGESEQVKYHVYDLISNAPFPQRYLKLLELARDQPHIEIVHTARINNLDELKHYHQEYLSQGYEGTIIRHTEAGYAVNKRVDQLLKYKDFIDQAYEIIDVIPSEKRPDHGMFVCKGVDNSGHEITFNTGMKFTHVQREYTLKNKGEYIGEMAEVRFFEFTDSGVPRFPVAVGVRLDK